MKKIHLVLFLLCSVFFYSQDLKKKVGPPEGEAKVGEFYGENPSASSIANVTKAKKLVKKLNKSGKKIENISLKGKVVNVCEKKGCWMTLEAEDKTTYFVQMKDYGFFVPTALKGKNVVIEGNAEKKVTSVAEQKHYAEDAKEPIDKINKITEPKVEYTFMAKGITVVQ